MIKKMIIGFGLIIGAMVMCWALIDTAEVRSEQVREKQNKEWYEEATKCIDSGRYEEALQLLDKLPWHYEDAEDIASYAEFCKAVQDDKGIEELYDLTLDFPYIDMYEGRYAKEMQTAKANIRAKYDEVEAQKEKEKIAKIREDTPYKGMKQKYINCTILGSASEKREGHYWRNAPGRRIQEVQYVYIWYNKAGGKKFMATCRNGYVSSTVRFSQTASSYSAVRQKSRDMDDARDYDDPEDFYYDHKDEFDDIQDAEDYWEEAQ